MKKLSQYTISSNCSDISDCTFGINEISEEMKNRSRNSVKIPDYFYTRLKKLLDKRDNLSIKKYGIKFGNACQKYGGHNVYGLDGDKQKSYITSNGNLSNPLEVADWLYKYIKRNFGCECTYSYENTIKVLKAFSKRYELEYYSDAEKYIKGLSWNGEVLAKYNVQFDTQFGMYQISIEKKDSNLNGTKKADCFEEKTATALTITVLKSSAFISQSQTFKRRSTTTKPRLVSYTINGLSAPTKLKQFIDKTKLIELINDFNIDNANDFIGAIGRCFPQQVEKEKNNKETKFRSKYQLLDFSKFGVKILLRVSDHNINANNIQDDVEEAYSIVIKERKSKNTFINREDVEIKEYVYFEDNCDRNRYLLIAKNIYNLLETSEWNVDFVKADVTNESPKIKFRNSLNGNSFDTNKKIISLLETKTEFSDTEKELLRTYSGNGGFAKETMKTGALNEFYTPDFVCEYMYQIAKKHGFSNGNILEPSCATGNIIRPFYERGDYKNIEAFEIDIISKKICSILYPNVNIHQQYFETAFLEGPRFTTKAKKTWLKNYPFDLVIGNPPYGQHKNKYSSYFIGKEHFQQIEMFFMYKCLQLLRPKGLLIFITSTNFISTGSAYQDKKQIIGEVAELIDAYRLPSVFERTEICTDIIVLQKK